MLDSKLNLLTKNKEQVTYFKWFVFILDRILNTFFVILDESAHEHEGFISDDKENCKQISAY